MINNDENSIIFHEIIVGYSPVIHPTYGELFIKHISHIESLNIEREYLKAFNEAKKNKLPLNSEREKVILNEKLWTEKEENDIKNTKNFIQSLKETISSSYLLSKRRTFKREMNDAEKRLDMLLMKKDYLLGYTAEKFAQKQSFNFNVINSFYEDEKLTKKLIIDNLSEEDYEKLSEIYKQYSSKITIDIIKKIAVSSLFSSTFTMAADNAYYFYGKPIVQLTTHQTNLFLMGKYFGRLMSQYGDRISKEILDNTEEVLERLEIVQNVEKSGVLKDTGDENVSATSIMGANREDLIAMGVDPSQIMNLSERIAKSPKGMLDKNDLYKLKS